MGLTFFTHPSDDPMAGSSEHSAGLNHPMKFSLPVAQNPGNDILDTALTALAGTAVEGGGFSSQWFEGHAQQSKQDHGHNGATGYDPRDPRYTVPSANSNRQQQASYHPGFGKGQQSGQQHQPWPQHQFSDVNPSYIESAYQPSMPDMASLWMQQQACQQALMQQMQQQFGAQLGGCVGQAGPSTQSVPDSCNMNMLHPQLLQQMFQQCMPNYMQPNSVTSEAYQSQRIAHEMQSSGDLVRLCKYVCGYCNRTKLSASIGHTGRIRIRCECGGKHHDSVPRMHGMWTIDADEETQTALTFKNFRRKTKRQVVAEQKPRGVKGVTGLANPSACKENQTSARNLDLLRIR